MANANDIDTYHQHLLAALNSEELLGQPGAIRATPGRNWQNPKFKGSIDFDLWPTETPMTAMSDQNRELALFAFERIKKIGGGELEEIEDKGDSGICWISWHERWERLVPEGVFPGKKARQPHFMLGTIQWILFWGRADDERKVQIVRAEWDNATHVTKRKREYDEEKDATRGRRDENGASDAGQPHWHIDRVLELGDVAALAESRGTDLEELARQPMTGKYLHLQRVHLAMGGWKNKPPDSVAAATAEANHAARWQINYTEDRDELIEWNLCTLRYIKSQTHFIDNY